MSVQSEEEDTSAEVCSFAESHDNLAYTPVAYRIKAEHARQEESTRPSLERCLIALAYMLSAVSHGDTEVMPAADG